MLIQIAGLGMRTSEGTGCNTTGRERENLVNSTIEFIDSRIVIVNNLSFICEVSEEYKHIIKDNAKFI